VHNFPCAEDGKNCVKKKDEPMVTTQMYKDPSTDVNALYERLGGLKKEEITATKRHIRA